MRANLEAVKQYAEALLSDSAYGDVMEIAVKVAKKFDLSVSEAMKIVDHTPFALKETSENILHDFVAELIKIAHKHNLSVGHFQKECFFEIGETVCDGVIGWKEALQEIVSTAYEGASLSAEAKDDFKNIILDWEGAEMTGEPF